MEQKHLCASFLSWWQWGGLRVFKKKRESDTKREREISFIYEDKCQQSGTASLDGRCQVARSSILSAGDGVSLPGYSPRTKLSHRLDINSVITTAHRIWPPTPCLCPPITHHVLASFWQILRLLLASSHTAALLNSQIWLVTSLDTRCVLFPWRKSTVYSSPCSPSQENRWGFSFNLSSVFLQLDIILRLEVPSKFGAPTILCTVVSQRSFGNWNHLFKVTTFRVLF